MVLKTCGKGFAHTDRGSILSTVATAIPSWMLAFEERRDANGAARNLIATGTEPSFSIRHQVTVHWGLNHVSERQDAKPTSFMGCKIQYTQGALPDEETGWTSLGHDTTSPMLHHIPDAALATFIYRACYVDKRLNYGNFGDPVECTVSM